jgi:APA family basic amino acid/polyamine antiporter
VALFAYLGIETASVAAGRVKNPGRNVFRATVYGTVICAIVYILGTLAVFGTVSNKNLRLSTAPFSDAANAIFGGTWAGQTIAVVASSILATLLMILAYTNFDQVFTTVILLTVFTSVIPYLFSAAAQCYWLLTGGRSTSWPHFAKDFTIATLALVFTFWALAGSGAEAAYYGVFCFLLGVPLYVWLRVSSSRNEHASLQTPSTPAPGATTQEPEKEPVL